MAVIGDYVNPDWTNDVTKLNATNMQAITDKIAELDLFAKHRAYLKKSADQTINNSTTLVDDNTFSITLPASKIYKIELYLQVDGGNTTCDFKTKWVCGGGCSQLTAKSCYGASTLTSNILDGNIMIGVFDVTSEVEYGLDGTYTNSIREVFLVQTSASIGTLKLQFAQKTAQAVNTNVRDDASFMIIEELVVWS
jgi:hypothetical protein